MNRPTTVTGVTGAENASFGFPVIVNILQSQELVCLSPMSPVSPVKNKGSWKVYVALGGEVAGL